MPRTNARPATYADLLKVPDHVVAEIVEGELFTSPRPASRHAHATMSLSAKLHSEFGGGGDDGPGGWWILFEPELHLGSDVLVPDIAGWRRERMPELPDVAAFELAPDWICEVISPATGRLDRVKKLPRYATYDVQFAWLVDPVERSVLIYALENGRWYLDSTHEKENVIRAVPFDAIELNLARLWI